MDVLPVLLTTKKQLPGWASWMLTSEITPRIGYACGNRLLMLGFFHTALHPSRISFMVTTQGEALRELPRQRPGVLIVTEQLEEGSGLALVAQARSVIDNIRTVLIVDGQYDNLAAAGLSSADAVIDQHDCFSADQPLVTMFRMLSINRRYRSASVLAALAERQQQSELWRDAPPDLTSRELEMVDLMLAGLNDRQIAERLEVGYEAARSYTKNLRRKLGAKTRAQAGGRLIELGIGRLRGKNR